MPAPQRVRAWIASNYKRPAVDQEWLADCAAWISSELGLDPDADFDKFVHHVEAQLLQSNLADSTVPGSGIDPLLVASNPVPARPRPSGVRRPAARQAPRRKQTTGPVPLLVEIKGITEIAHSAFTLLNTHQIRADRADLGLAHEQDAGQDRDEDEGPIPRFPRGMLRFELSDGLTTFRAVEFRSLPQLELGTTPLGYKMFLKSTPIRNGVAFLQPENVDLKGYKTEDHDVHSEQVFLSSLRKRLGRPDPPPEAPVAQPHENPPGNPPARPAPARQHEPPHARPQSRAADIDDMHIDDDVDPDVLREMAIQMDEAVDMQQHQRVGIRAPPLARPPPTFKERHVTGSNPKSTLHPSMTPAPRKAPSSSTSVKTSPYFSAHSSKSPPIPDVGLSPRPVPSPNPEPDFDITWDTDDTEPSKLSIKKTGTAPAKFPSTASAKRVGPPEERSASPDPYDDLSFDMDIDESFIEQVGMIEQGALGAGTDKGKGKGKDTGTQVTTSHSRLGSTSTKRAPSGSVPGTKRLAKTPVSHPGAEPPTRVQPSAKRATSASSLSGSAESVMPYSTQSSDHLLSRDPSLIIVSSEDEAPAAEGRISAARSSNLARRRAKKRREMDQDEIDVDVIEISD